VQALTTITPPSPHDLEQAERVAALLAQGDWDEACEQAPLIRGAFGVAVQRKARLAAEAGRAARARAPGGEVDAGVSDGQAPS